MRYVIIDSDSGDQLGSIDIDSGTPDEYLLEQLVTAGYLTPPAGCYELVDEAYLMDPGTRAVYDEFGDPVLALEPEEVPEPANGDDDDEDDEAGKSEAL